MRLSVLRPSWFTLDKAFDDAITLKLEDVMAVLRDYHRTLGEIIVRYEGTLERFAGDGMLIQFNDPVPCSDHSKRAIGMSSDIRDGVQALACNGRRGVTHSTSAAALRRATPCLARSASSGVMTMRRSVRLPMWPLAVTTRPFQARSWSAKRFQALVDMWIRSVPIGDRSLKGFSRAIAAHDIIGWRDAQASYRD